MLLLSLVVVNHLLLVATHAGATAEAEVATSAVLTHAGATAEAEVPTGAVRMEVVVTAVVNTAGIEDISLTT